MNKKSQLQNGVIYMVPVLIGAILPIITLPLFTRVLSPNDFGVYALAQVYAIFVSGIANLGLATGYERNFFEHTEVKKRSGLLYSVVAFSIVSLTLFGTITFLFKDKLATLVIGYAKFSDILFWSYCTVGISSVKAYYLTFFKNTGNARAYAWYTIDENLIGVSISLFMVLYLKTGVMGLVMGPFIAGVMVTLFLMFKFLKNLPIAFNSNLLFNSLRISLPLTPRIFFGVIGTQFDKYMIGLLSTIGGVGIYNIGQKFANIVFTFMTAVQNVFSPHVYQLMFEKGTTAGKEIGRYLTPFLYLCIFVGLMISLFAEEIIWILTPVEYHDASSIASVLCILYSTYFFGKQPQLIYAKKAGLISLITIVTIVLNVLINYPFIRIWGVMGAAYGTLLAGFISGFISFKLSQKHFKIDWETNKLVMIYTSLFFAVAVTIIMKEYEVVYLIRVFTKIGFLVLFVFIGVKNRCFE